jgi:hypothetical protein
MTVEQSLDGKAMDPEYRPGTANLQLLPCRVHHTGPAAVSTYLIEESNAKLTRSNRYIEGKRATWFPNSCE